MSDVANIAAAAVNRAAAQPAPTEGANNVFKVMHGFYGNLFLSKFATGQIEAREDLGIVSARQIWAHGLREFAAGTVKAALAQCLERHPEFPPSLPQFVQLCRANAPRATYKPATPAIGVSQELRSAYARKMREAIAKHEQKARDRAVGHVEIEEGLDGLKRALANAVATAGGDEVAELRRFDAMFAGVPK